MDLNNGLHSLCGHVRAFDCLIKRGPIQDRDVDLELQTLEGLLCVFLSSVFVREQSPAGKLLGHRGKGA